MIAQLEIAIKEQTTFLSYDECFIVHEVLVPHQSTESVSRGKSLDRLGTMLTDSY
jgi:hypothetical protein